MAEIGVQYPKGYLRRGKREEERKHRAEWEKKKFPPS